MAYHQSSGDVAGLEVFVVYTREGYAAVVQVAQGVPNTPVVVPVKLNDSTVAFTMPLGGRQLRFEGKIDRDGLVGKFDNGAFSDRQDGRIMLKRTRSYWQ